MADYDCIVSWVIDLQRLRLCTCANDSNSSLTSGIIAGAKSDRVTLLSCMNGYI